jgi:hypothetical protein
MIRILGGDHIGKSMTCGKNFRKTWNWTWSMVLAKAGSVSAKAGKVFEHDGLRGSKGYWPRRRGERTEGWSAGVPRDLQLELALRGPRKQFARENSLYFF